MSKKKQANGGVFNGENKVHGNWLKTNAKKGFRDTTVRGERLAFPANIFLSFFLPHWCLHSFLTMTLFPTMHKSMAFTPFSASLQPWEIRKWNSHAFFYYFTYPCIISLTPPLKFQTFLHYIFFILSSTLPVQSLKGMAWAALRH